VSGFFSSKIGGYIRDMFPTKKKIQDMYPTVSVICAISDTDTPGIHTSQGEPNLEVNLGPTQPSYHLRASTMLGA
jgi:hypothetical protein